ncbi:MAG: ABC transporter substrate-binding protein [Nitrososphaeria archaeon]
MPSEPSVLDSLSGAWTVAPFAGNILNSLLETNENMEIVPSLAESYVIDYTNKQYIFKIRSGVKWHDGKPLTVEDVKFTFEYLIPNYDNRGYLLKGTTVTIINSTTVAIKPATFAPGFQIARFACADWQVYPKHILEGVDITKSDYRKAPIGTGPFKFKEWVKGDHITLVRNEAYWKQGLPYLDQIIVKFINDPAVLLSALLTGTVDYVYRGLPYESYDALKNAGLNVFVDYKPNYKVYIQFNLKHPILSNELVRKAIAHALDKEDIVYKATNNLSRPSDRFWAPEFMPENPELVAYSFDPKKAEELLDRAGFVKGSDGKRFEIELLVRSGEADEMKTAELVRNYLNNVGIYVKIKSADFATVESLQANYQYEMAIIKRWINPVFAYQNHHSSFIKPGTPLVNLVQYNNSEVDYWYDQWAYHATSEEERTQALLNVETILTKDLPELPLYDVAWLYVWNKRVGGAFVPSRNWLQSEALETVYIIEAPTTTTHTPSTTTTQPITGLEPIHVILAVVIVVIILLVIALLIKRRR